MTHLERENQGLRQLLVEERRGMAELHQAIRAFLVDPSEEVFQVLVRLLDVTGYVLPLPGESLE